MKHVRNGGTWLLRLERGDDIVETLRQFVRAKNVRSGFFTGLGAAEQVALGMFDPVGRAYRKRLFKGDHELAALVGNIAWDGEEPVCHTHAVISNRRMQAFAGHLLSARVTVTCEISLVPGPRTARRRTDAVTSLKLLALGR
jgi:predicted DNA-binding protein with PD1-like motif